MSMAVSGSDLWNISSCLILMAGGILLLLFGVFRKERGGLPWICLGTILLALFTSFLFWDRPAYSFQRMLVVDNFSVFFHFILLTAAGLSVLMSVDYLREKGMESGEYYALILLSVLGMILMSSGLNLVILFLGLEILSLSLYILSGFNRNDARSIESSLKYFLLGAFATGFLLYGMALIYGSVGSLGLEEIAASLRNSNPSPGTMFFMGIGLLIVGFGFKVASVPFHIWVPDVYEGAPTPVTAFMSIGAKASGFAALMRVFFFALQGVSVDWVWVFWVLSAVTMTLGNVAAISQTNIKRMLAYSAVAHTGYVLIGMVAENSLGLQGMLFYFLAYAFMNLGAFTVVILLERSGEEALLIENYSGLGSKKPFYAVAMAVFMFSLAGIPPTAGFMGKFYLFSSAVRAGYIWLAVLGVLNSLISVYYYLRIVVMMYMKEPGESAWHFSFSAGLMLVLLIAFFATLYLGIFPSFSFSFIQKVSFFIAS